MPCCSEYWSSRARGFQSASLGSLSLDRAATSCASSMAFLRAFSLLSFSCCVLYISTSAACRHAALKSASANLGDCGCSRAYFSYSSDSFSGQCVSPFHDPQSLLSIRLYAARSDHFVCGYFFITSFMFSSSLGVRRSGLFSRDEARKRTAAFSSCQRISAARHNASPESGELGQ